VLSIFDNWKLFTAKLHPILGRRSGVPCIEGHPSFGGVPPHRDSLARAVGISAYAHSVWAGNQICTRAHFTTESSPARAPRASRVARGGPLVRRRVFFARVTNAPRRLRSRQDRVAFAAAHTLRNTPPSPPHAQELVIMASSLATHQFAGASAQFKCVARARFRARECGDFHAGIAPGERERHSIFGPRAARNPAERAARARPPRPAKRSFADELRRPPSPARSAAARKNVKAARNVQVRPPATRCFVALSPPPLPRGAARGGCSRERRSSARTRARERPSRAPPRAPPPRARPPPARAARDRPARDRAPRRRRPARARGGFEPAFFLRHERAREAEIFHSNPPCHHRFAPETNFSPSPLDARLAVLPPAAPSRPPSHPLIPIPPRRTHRTRPAPRCPSPRRRPSR